MINIFDKKECCGCSACFQKCPRKCISMVMDEEGFSYPIVESANCIDCHVCEKVCPVLNRQNPQKPISCYAAINTNVEIHRKSSSGGIFTLIGENIINRGGVVFGASFNKDWVVEHSFSETVVGLSKFRGSKYVQSDISECYSKVEIFLKKGRIVLFSGTPCQIAGLKSFLIIEYENLITLDFICHGVPSPEVFKRYLHENFYFRNIKDISFRYKKYSNGYGFCVLCEDGEFYSDNSDNPYLKGFSHNLYLRPSCHDCKFKCLSSGSDITLADFWRVDKIHPQYKGKNGVSCIILNTEKGYQLCKPNIKEWTISDITFVEKYNSSINKSTPLTNRRHQFFSQWKNVDLVLLINLLTKISFCQKLKSLVSIIYRKIHP